MKETLLLCLLLISPAFGIDFDPMNAINELKELIEDGVKWGSRKFPCSCANVTCSCCCNKVVSSNVICASITFDQENNSFCLKLIFNDKEILANTMEAIDPPPACLPIPYMPFVSLCIDCGELHIDDLNVSACFSIIGQIAGNDVFTHTLDCLQVGADGIKLLGSDGVEGSTNEKTLQKSNRKEIWSYLRTPIKPSTNDVMIKVSEN